MPLFDFRCCDCEKVSELLLSPHATNILCPSCGGSDMEKQLSAPSSLTGKAAPDFPAGAPCCGTGPTPGGCPGPGSCGQFCG